MLTLLLLTFAVSLDGFGVGVMYGIRQIKVPIISIIIISLCSGIVMIASMHVGVWLLHLMSPDFAKKVGAIILIGIGIWAIIQFLSHKNHDVAPQHPKNKQNEYRFEIKRLGLVIHILRTPSKADIDRSGSISAAEATFLGIALSLDAFGAGIGAALIGLSPWLSSLFIALSSGVFIWLGLQIGFLFASMNWIKKLSFLPGFILIMMGIFKLL